MFEIDIEQCPQVRWHLKIIAAIEHPGDRQDPHAPRLVRPGTAPSSGQFDRFQLA